MRVLLDVNHAAHVHFIRALYFRLKAEGHSPLVVASDKPLVYKLLEEFEIEHVKLGSYGRSLFRKFLMLVVIDIKLLFFCLRYRPSLILGIVSIRGSHVGWLLRFPSIVFTDTEHAAMQIALFKPFATAIYTPKWFQKQLGSKQVRYHGFHELAYLHPETFRPSTEIFDLLEIDRKEPFFIVRFVAWDATHDLNESGFSQEGKSRLVSMLKKWGRVFISSEGPIDAALKEYEFSIPPSLMHDALFYSRLYIGEGATMAAEAALLGTPSIYLNSLKLGYISVLEEEYGLLIDAKNEQEAISKCQELLKTDDLNDTWKRRRNRLLEECTNTTDLIHEIVHSYEVSK